MHMFGIHIFLVVNLQYQDQQIYKFSLNAWYESLRQLLIVLCLIFLLIQQKGTCEFKR